MSKEVPREAIAAFKIKCVGADPKLTIQEVEATVTVNNDGTREVGCPYIGTVGANRGNCFNSSGVEVVKEQNCVHLYPQ